ncbi:MAG: thioredoxin [Deltaproteobacteria bacterium]|nr:thioredoxin [Deltaproteobacteria bacterium]MBW2256312.1 thioredoxin [Deltaproteobacteria bacterium]
MASDHIQQATDANFQVEVLDSDKPVLVDFWATWCAPCRAITPLLETLAEEQADALKIVKLDVQSNMQTAMTYGVTNIPTLLVFKGGAQVGRKVGAGGGLAALRTLVAPHL